MKPSLENFSRKIRENLTERARDSVVSWLLWALLVDVEVGYGCSEESTQLCDGPDQEQLQQKIKAEVRAVINDPQFQFVVFSVLKHTSHVDTLVLREAIRREFPEVRSRLLLIADEGMWRTRFRRFMAFSVIKEIFLFNKSHATKETYAQTKLELAKRMYEDNLLLALYAPGTRNPEAKPGDFAAHFASSLEKNRSEIPDFGDQPIQGAIIYCDISDLSSVLPKVEKTKELEQAEKRFLDRLKKVFSKRREHRARFTFAKVVPISEEQVQQDGSVQTVVKNPKDLSVRAHFPELHRPKNQ